MEFYRNRKKSINLLLVLSGILVLMLVILLYSSGIISAEIIGKGIAFSSIASVILAIIIIKTLISLKDKSPLIILTPEGIISKVTAVSKAAGLILWKDINDIQLQKVGGDTLVALIISTPEPYSTKIRKKLSSIALDKDQDLHIYMTASVLDINAQELFDKIKTYSAQVNQDV